MYSSKIPISSIAFDSIDGSRIALRNPVFGVEFHRNPTGMWRNIAKQMRCRNSSLSAARSFLGFSQGSPIPEKSKSRRLFELNSLSPVVQFQRNGDIESFSGRNRVNFYGLCCRSLASVAEAVTSHTDVDEDGRDSSGDVSAHQPDEVEELLNVMRKEERRVYAKKWRNQRYSKMGNAKYYALKRRQARMETEAWKQAAKEYLELLNDMCEQKLAPNLPYMKSLFLGWFEPLRDKIAEEQEMIKNGKSKAGHAKYFVLLPADMMAVVTMHKLLGLLMTGGEHGSARVVHAACTIGDAIEQEVGLPGLY